MSHFPAVVPAEWYLILGGMLFSIGIVGVVIRRNAIVLLMCIELMLNAANIVIVGYSQVHQSLSAQVFVLFIMLVAAVEVAVGLGIFALIFHNRETTNIDEVAKLKW